jgi:hypothetical protein
LRTAIAGRAAAHVERPFTVERAYIASAGFHDFGKGCHAAGLHFGTAHIVRRDR